MKRRKFIAHGVGALTTPKGASIVAWRYIGQTLGLSIDSAAPVEHDAPA